MKKTAATLLLVLVLLAASFGGAQAAKPTPPTANDGSGCATIRSGTITDSAGHPLKVGFDEYGYNYQAHLFVGTYDSVDRVLDGKYWGATGDYVDDMLTMKWSDAWLANVDCNGDHKLDRGLVNGTVGGTSLGWETNHVQGDYLDSEGNLQHYTYFAKIVWIGPGGDLWGQYTTIQENINDPANRSHYHTAAPGFGLNDHWTTNVK